MTNGEAKSWLKALSPVIKCAMKKHASTLAGYELCDLEQEAWIGLQEILGSGVLDNERNVIAYARKAVRNMVHNLVVQEKAGHAREARYAVGIKAFSRTCHEIDLLPDVESITRRLTRDERLVFRHLSDGIPRGDFMTETGMSSNKYYQHKARVQTKVAAIL